MTTYNPVTLTLGNLPEFPTQQKTYDFSDLLPKGEEIKEILVYAFVTTCSKGEFQRGYYEIYTNDGEKKYKHHLNVATGAGLAAVNSANMWLPVGEGKLTINLVHPQDENRSIAHKEGTSSQKTDNPMQKDWSHVFVTGYRA